MENEFEAGFSRVQNLDQYYQNGGVQDIPLSNELLDGFGFEAYQISAPGGLPSPNFSNPDLPASGRQSPFFPSLSPFTSQMDGASGVHDDFLDLPVLQQPQESGTGRGSNIGSNTGNQKPNTNQTLSDASSGFSESHGWLSEPSVISSSHLNMRRCPNLMLPSDRSVCSSDQTTTSPVPSESSIEQSTRNWPMSTHELLASKTVNNTSSASAPANQQHSPKAHHFVRNPSHLRNQIHPELLQNSPLTATATEGHSISQPPLTMSSRPNFTNRQDLPSYNDHQTVRHAPHKPQFRGITSIYNQSRESAVLQNYQPFRESSLRSPVASALEQDAWEAAQFEVPQYPELQPAIQQQPDRSSYLGHHVSQPQGSSTNSYPSAQYLMQSSDSRDASFMSQGSTEVGCNGSSTKSIKREISPPDSECSVSTPTIKSQIASPRSQRKRRSKRGVKDKAENEAVIDPAALQTADLTNLDPTDHEKVAALIGAMHNTLDVEDNQGMQKTWEKIRRAKAFRIKEVSVELLDLTKQAQQKKGSPLGEKNPVNHYASFQKRFDALRETLMYQKTVCKHLIEPPYAYAVVDDPQNARDRVKNNRRVNHQKAEAIRLGREHLGEKGQGKGRPMLKTKKRVQAQMEDSEDDEENSGDDALSDGEMEGSPRLLGPKSGCLGSRAHKRIKRSTDSTPRLEHRDTVQASYSPQSQIWEDPFAQNFLQNGQSPTQQWQMPSDHYHGLPGLVANQQMPTLNQGYPFHSAQGSGINSYGNNSTAGSDDEGLGATECEHK